MKHQTILDAWITLELLRPQLKNLEKNINRWNERYQVVEAALKEIKGIEVPVRFEEERYVGSSIQFRLPGITVTEAELFIKKNKELGVELKWFGNDDPSGCLLYTSPSPRDA